MSGEFIPFWKLVLAAEQELQSADDPIKLEDLAHALIRRQPGSAIGDRLLEQAAYLRDTASRLQSAGVTKVTQVLGRTAA